MQSSQAAYFATTNRHRGQDWYHVFGCGDVSCRLSPKRAWRPRAGRISMRRELSGMAVSASGGVQLRLAFASFDSPPPLEAKHLSSVFYWQRIGQPRARPVLHTGLVIPRLPGMARIVGLCSTLIVVRQVNMDGARVRRMSHPIQSCLRSCCLLGSNVR